jgi:hypothetical protein
MNREIPKDLVKFLKPYDKKVAETAEVVLFRRTLFLSDFQTDIIQNGGW